MKATMFLLALAGSALGGLINERTAPTCAADNCARAVTGTAKGTATAAAHSADCSSFQHLTTYFNAGNTVKPTAVPAYASACSGTARYASACACWGFPVQTTTVYPYSDDNFEDDTYYEKQ